MISLFVWWYTAGWSALIHRIAERIGGVSEFFSVGLLFKTLFDPFRQIDAGRVRGSLDAELRAWGNRLFSRFVGAFMRLIMIIVGLAGLLAMSVIGLIQLIIWPFIPLLPLVGLLLMVWGARL